ncbi:MAG: hypothetical protein HY320_02145 [Armatimonadetes bacterium]|nr:hypothetical protein [Armatimonadota bacterium]
MISAAPPSSGWRTAWLGETINQVRRGDLDPKVATTVGHLSGILLKALEVGGIEERLAALEATVRERPRRLFYGDPAEYMAGDVEADRTFIFVNPEPEPEEAAA